MAEKKMTVFEKAAAVQNELVAPKGQRNDFGKYNYRSSEDILVAVKPICAKYKSMIYMTNELKQIGDRYYVNAIVTFVDLETGEKIVSEAQAREEDTKKGMDGSQITGASSSYARKYALAGLFCIDNEKDSDATNHGGADAVYPEPLNKSTQKITKEQVQLIFELLNKKHIPQAQVAQNNGGKSVTQLTAEEAVKTIRALNEVPDPS